MYTRRRRRFTPPNCFECIFCTDRQAQIDRGIAVVASRRNIGSTRARWVDQPWRLEISDWCGDVVDRHRLSIPIAQTKSGVLVVLVVASCPNSLSQGSFTTRLGCSGKAKSSCSIVCRQQSPDCSGVAASRLPTKRRSFSFIATDCSQLVFRGECVAKMHDMT